MHFSSKIFDSKGKINQPVQLDVAKNRLVLKGGRFKRWIQRIKSPFVKKLKNMNEYQQQVVAFSVFRALQDYKTQFPPPQSLEVQNQNKALAPPPDTLKALAKSEGWLQNGVLEEGMLKETITRGFTPQEVTLKEGLQQRVFPDAIFHHQGFDNIKEALFESPEAFLDGEFLKKAFDVIKHPADQDKVRAYNKELIRRVFPCEKFTSILKSRKLDIHEGVFQQWGLEKKLQDFEKHLENTLPEVCHSPQEYSSYRKFLLSEYEGFLDAALGSMKKAGLTLPKSEKPFENSSTLPPMTTPFPLRGKNQKGVPSPFFAKQAQGNPVALEEIPLLPLRNSRHKG